MMPRIVDDAKDSSLLESDLDRLISWSHTWQISFNVGKCKVVYFGCSNLKFNYCMNDEKDLGMYHIMCVYIISCVYIYHIMCVYIISYITYKS